MTHRALKLDLTQTYTDPTEIAIFAAAWVSTTKAHHLSLRERLAVAHFAVLQYRDAGAEARNLSAISKGKL